MASQRTQPGIDAGQLDHVSLQMGDMSERMREIAREQTALMAQLGQGYDEWIRAEMERLLRVQETVQRAIAQQGTQAANNLRQQGQAMGTGEKKDNKAAEKGSTEAFSIIAGAQTDKMYTVLNQIVNELRTTRDVDRATLRELQRNLRLEIARL